MKKGPRIARNRWWLWGVMMVCAVPWAGFSEGLFADEELPLISLGLGVSGVFDPHQDPFVSIEYRPAFRIRHVGPWIYFKHGKDDDSYLAAGLLANLFWGEHWVLTPKFGGGYYDEKDGTDLGNELQFRSELECSYRFRNEHRLGLSIAHLSNAGISSWNPGTEYLAFAWSIPLGRYGKKTTTSEHE